MKDLIVAITILDASGVEEFDQYVGIKKLPDDFVENNLEPVGMYISRDNFIIGIFRDHATRSSDVAVIENYGTYQLFR